MFTIRKSMFVAFFTLFLVNFVFGFVFSGQMMVLFLTMEGDGATLLGIIQLLTRVACMARIVLAAVTLARSDEGYSATKVMIFSGIAFSLVYLRNVIYFVALNNVEFVITAPSVIDLDEWLKPSTADLVCQIILFILYISSLIIAFATETGNVSGEFGRFFLVGISGVAALYTGISFFAFNRLTVLTLAFSITYIYKITLLILQIFLIITLLGSEYTYVGEDTDQSINESTKEEKIQCEFTDGQGGVLDKEYCSFDGLVSYKGKIPYRKEEAIKEPDGSWTVTKYKFSGWDKSLRGITEPTTFAPLYTSEILKGAFKVSFQKSDGTEIYHVFVKKGEKAFFPADSLSHLIASSYSFDKDNVTMFAGFDKPLDNVTSDLIVKANVVTIPRTRNGEWPQTIVTDASLASALDSITVKDGQGYVSYNGEKYARDGSHWRKVEPIEWRFLSREGKNVRFVSEKVLGYHVWNETEHSDGIYLNNYKYSDIRKWLNSDFLQQAFYYDPSLIQTTEVDNSPESTGDSSNRYVCENTNDKVYLLSYNDVTNGDYGFGTTESRIAYDVDGQSSWYWLRSPYYYFGRGAYYVNQNGVIDNNDGGSVKGRNGVRPALTMKFE